MSPAAGSCPSGAPSSDRPWGGGGGVSAAVGGSGPFGRALQRQLVGKRRGLLDVVVVAEGERQRQLGGEIARRGVVVQPGDELRIAEGDPDRRALRGVGVLVAGGWARTWRRIRGARPGGAVGPVAVLVSPTASRERDGRQERE